MTRLAKRCFSAINKYIRKHAGAAVKLLHKAAAAQTACLTARTYMRKQGKLLDLNT